MGDVSGPSVGTGMRCGMRTVRSGRNRYTLAVLAAATFALACEGVPGRQGLQGKDGAGGAPGIAGTSGAPGKGIDPSVNGIFPRSLLLGYTADVLISGSG